MNKLENLTIDPALDLVLERVVDVPREILWQAWTQPEHLMEWFAPKPWSTIDCKIDLRPGGIFYTVMQSPEGKEYPNAGAAFWKLCLMRSLSSPMRWLPDTDRLRTRFLLPLSHSLRMQAARDTGQSLFTKTRLIENSTKRWGFMRVGANAWTNLWPWQRHLKSNWTLLNEGHIGRGHQIPHRCIQKTTPQEGRGVVSLSGRTERQGRGVVVPSIWLVVPVAFLVPVFIVPVGGGGVSLVLY